MPIVPLGNWARREDVRFVGKFGRRMPEAKQAFQFGEQFRGELTILGGQQRFQELCIQHPVSQAELGLRTRMRGQVRAGRRE